MDFVRNFPFMSIILSLFSGPLTSILNGKWAKRLNTLVIGTVGIMSSFVLAYTLKTKQAFVYIMGHFPAPWGNEIRVGILEAFMAVFFCIIMMLCMMGGIAEREAEIEESKQNLYYIMVNLLLCSLLALIYTNDLFTAYVFVEINTISACGLIMIRQNGRNIEAATRYMIMSLLGSGLLLLGICFLYDLTGQLLMSNIKEAVQLLAASGQYHVPDSGSGTDVRWSGHQECALSLPRMAAGCLRLFYPVLGCDFVLPGVQGLYFPAGKDFLQGHRVFGSL